LQNAQTGQQVSIGFGFRERSSAFEMNAAIQDQIRRLQRHLNPVLVADLSDVPDQPMNPHSQEQKVQLPNLQLDRDQTISLTIKGVPAKQVSPTVVSNASQQPISNFRLAPPPKDLAANDEWTDFVEAQHEQDVEGAPDTDDAWGNFEAAVISVAPSHSQQENSNNSGS
jgi:hypothetical protein